MKIAYTSDCHLEFKELTLNNTEGADVLVLAGDICVAKDLQPYDDAWENQRSQRIHEFFINCSKEFKEIIYIAGNHEHYHGDYKYTIDNLRKNLGYIKNLHILEKQSIEFDGVTFVCGTMWTDFNDGDPSTLMSIAYAMNDFRVVKNSLKTEPINTMDGELLISSKFTPEYAWGEHIKFVDFLNKSIENKSKVVVVTHHGPSYKSIHPKYADDYEMNGGYVSNLEDIIEPNPQIKYWIHGHIHWRQEYKVGETIVCCNPRGYAGYEPIADNFELRYIEI